MDTKPLARFATWARRELISVIDAQVSTVLAESSVARAEHPEAVQRLESEIEKHGYQHVVDKVAYTWFNRIIALRFMDVRGYTDAGIVSPMRGQEAGQPEILSDAKRGNLDSVVITHKRTEDAILGLIDGTRHSTDPEGEAYAILLTEYCRYWHKSMPFMFEREGDYTELLVPANLLAEDAILARTRKVLDEEVCKDVEVIGWLYQFYISERKEEVFAAFKQNKKAGADEIPAATQLFTPHWIVRYLVENSVGRLWMLNHPQSRLVDRMDYYIAPVDEEANYLKISGPEELTVLDPACGSGHMLTYAFDLLYAIYEEEGYAPLEIPGLILTHNLYGTEIDPRAGALAAFALTMKAREKQRTFFNCEIRPHICVIESFSFTPDEIDMINAGRDNDYADEKFFNQFEHADTLGSLIQPEAQQVASFKAALETTSVHDDILHANTIDRARKLLNQAEILANRYVVVIANPPYMGTRNMNASLVEFAKANFPDTKSDLFAIFIERSLAFTTEGGLTAMITMQSWMFIRSFELLRDKLLRTAPPVTMLHLGERAFDSIGGAIVSTTAFVLEKSRDRSLRAVYVRATEGQNEAAKKEIVLAAIKSPNSSISLVASTSLKELPGAPIAYWLSDDVRRAFKAGKPLREIGSPKAGMHGGDVNRFARLWYEVDRKRSNYSASSTAEMHQDGSKWAGLNKGGGFRRWYGNQEYVIAFDAATYSILATHGNKLPSREFYFKESVAWSKVSSGAPAFRFYPEGFVFDVAGTPVFASRSDLLNLLGIGNSEMARVMLSAIAPTLNFEIGQIASLPILNLAADAEFTDRVKELVATAKRDWDDFETSWEFERPSWLPDSDSGPIQLHTHLEQWANLQRTIALRQQAREIENNCFVARSYGLESEVPSEVPLSTISLSRNVEFRYGAGKSLDEYASLERTDVMAELVSYAVGCMFGRYSLDKPGLILADQGATLQDYLEKVPSPTLTPDADNVIPFVDDGWFEDDIVERFREFLRTTFGAKHFEENLHNVEKSLGVKTLRDYFITRNGRSKFYDDHVKRYKKRPIYWMFSSPKGSFNALIYMHRYTPSTVSTVLNEYLREYRAKLEVTLTDIENAATGGSAKDQKEADRIRRILLELEEYEHDVLYPLATRQLPIDLDDGVLVNYLRFGRALKNIGLETNRKRVETWDWPVNKLEPLS